jgi:ribbon-helix-helix CopG family protein
MYDGYEMRRTNIYLSDEQLATLRALGEQRGQPVAELVREAVSSWLESQGVRVLGEDEWTQRFEALLARRGRIAQEAGWSPEDVERDVNQAVSQVRRARRARRR